MFPTRHCIDKYNKKDRSPFSLKRYDRPNLPILCLITLFYQLILCSSTKYPYLPYARFFHFNPPSPQNFCCRGVCEHPLPYKESPFFYKGICCDACSQSLWHIHVSYHHMRETTQTSQGKLLATFQSFAT